jgi:hypothetical protein
MAGADGAIVTNAPSVAMLVASRPELIK